MSSNFSSVSKVILRSLLRLTSSSSSSFKLIQNIPFSIPFSLPEISKHFPENSLINFSSISLSSLKLLILFFIRNIKNIKKNEFLNESFLLLKFLNDKKEELNNLAKDHSYRLHYTLDNHLISSSLTSSLTSFSTSNSSSNSSSNTNSNSSSSSSSSPSSTSISSFIRVGEVVENKLLGYRGICNYWTIDIPTKKQIISLLIDWYDYEQILNGIIPSQHFAEEFSIIRDPRLTRIHHHLISNYFTSYSSLLGIYIPNYQLAFSHPTDLYFLLEKYQKQPIFVSNNINKLKIKKSFIISSGNYLLFLFFDLISNFIFIYLFDQAPNYETLLKQRQDKVLKISNEIQQVSSYIFISIVNKFISGGMLPNLLNPTNNRSIYLENQLNPQYIITQTILNPNRNEISHPIPLNLNSFSKSKSKISLKYLSETAKAVLSPEENSFSNNSEKNKKKDNPHVGLIVLEDFINRLYTIEKLLTQLSSLQHEQQQLGLQPIEQLKRETTFDYNSLENLFSSNLYPSYRSYLTSNSTKHSQETYLKYLESVLTILKIKSELNSFLA